MKFFFNPETVAIVGASRNPMKFGSIILTNLFNLGYEGKIFPVNRRGEEIAGLKTYTSVKEIPDPVELAILAIPASATVAALKDCAQKGVRGVVIISSGFSESGPEGQRRQEEIRTTARSAGIRIIGPNTTGILNPYDRFTTTFVFLRDVKKGSVAFVAQTGMFAGMLMEWILSSESFGISKVAGLGNKCDVDDADVLEYLAEDEHTKVIMMYLESIKDGRNFMRAAKTTARGKPVLALKAGATLEGANAAMSHTGSLGGNDAVVSGAFRQAGIIRVDTVQELIDCAKMFAFQPVARGNRLAIVSLSGGAAVISADAAVRAGFKLAHFPAQLLSHIQKKYPPWATLRHPFDIEPLTETIGFQPAFEVVTRCALSNPETDACLVITWTPFPEAGFSFDFLSELQSEHPGKPIAFCSFGYKDYHEDLAAKLEARQLPVYSSFSRAIRALAASVEYGKFLGAVEQRHTDGQPLETFARPVSASKMTGENNPESSGEAGAKGRVTIFFDGASRGNPGPAAIGVVMKKPGGDALCEIGETIGNATNNYAEYSALIRGLEEARDLGYTDVECFSDSELVVRQMTGSYRVRSKDLLPLVSRAQALRRGFSHFSIRHIRREQNRKADALASKALKKKTKRS